MPNMAGSPEKVSENGDKSGSKLQSGGLVTDDRRKSLEKGKSINSFSILFEIEDVVDIHTKNIVHPKKDRKATAKAAEAKQQVKKEGSSSMFYFK